MKYKIFDEEGDIDCLDVIFRSLKLVEDDYLGGYGSRGYGRVKFTKISMSLKPRSYYEDCDDGKIKKLNTYNDLKEVLNKINEIKKTIKEEIEKEVRNSTTIREERES